jgi:hypothetical protein
MSNEEELLVNYLFFTETNACWAWPSCAAPLVKRT